MRSVDQFGKEREEKALSADPLNRRVRKAEESFELLSQFILQPFTEVLNKNICYYAQHIRKICRNTCNSIPRPKSECKIFIYAWIIMLLWLSGKVEKICAVEIANSRNFGRASLSLNHLSFPFGAHRGRSLFESWFAYSSSIQWRFPQWDPITIMTIKHANYFMVVPANSTRCPWKTASSLSSSLRVMEKRAIHAEKENYASRARW